MLTTSFFRRLASLFGLPGRSIRRRRPRRIHWLAGLYASVHTLEPLEDRLLLATFSEFIDPNPNSGNQFGDFVVPLSTGNVVITSPFDDAGGTDAGAVYLFDGSDGSLISTLMGSSNNDQVGSSGGVTALTNGNYVVSSRNWDNGAATDAGAATFGNGTSGVTGPVTAGNSAVGLTANTNLRPIAADDVNDNFYAPFVDEDNGKVRVGSPTDGFFMADPTINGTAIDDDIEVFLDGTELVVTVNGTEHFLQE